MKPIYYWPYQLQARRPLNVQSARMTHDGALIRMADGAGCIQPWTEFGHAPLAEQLTLLRDGGSSPLIARALVCCLLDGAARAQQASLFTGRRIPPSHATAPHLPSAGQCESWRAEGFSAVKLKAVLHDLEWISEFLVLTESTENARSPLLWRLDCNGRPTPQEFCAFAASLPGRVRKRIEFIEDPCPYVPAIWREVRVSTGLRLALDWQGGTDVEPDSFDVRVIKPAVQEVPDEPGDFIITSAMDHPIGQFFAACIAAQHANSVGLCGLLTHSLFEPNAFSERIQSDGPNLLPSGGTGLGFDDLIESLPWKRLR